MEAKMKTDTMTLNAGTTVWYLRNPEDIEAQRARDIANGRTMTDDGETILYSKVGSFRLKEDTIIIVTKRSKIEWPTWSRKPKHLTEGLIPTSVIPPGAVTAYNKVLFQR
jgi:hypothetical protein